MSTTRLVSLSGGLRRTVKSVRAVAGAQVPSKFTSTVDASSKNVAPSGSLHSIINGPTAKIFEEIERTVSSLPTLTPSQRLHNQLRHAPDLAAFFVAVQLHSEDIRNEPALALSVLRTLNATIAALKKQEPSLVTLIQEIEVLPPTSLEAVAVVARALTAVLLQYREVLTTRGEAFNSTGLWYAAPELNARTAMNVADGDPTNEAVAASLVPRPQLGQVARQLRSAIELFGHVARSRTSAAASDVATIVMPALFTALKGTVETIVVAHRSSAPGAVDLIDAVQTIDVVRATLRLQPPRVGIDVAALCGVAEDLMPRLAEALEAAEDHPAAAKAMAYFPSSLTYSVPKLGLWMPELSAALNEQALYAIVTGEWAAGHYKNFLVGAADAGVITDVLADVIGATCDEFVAVTGDAGDPARAAAWVPRVLVDMLQALAILGQLSLGLPTNAVGPVVDLLEPFKVAEGPHTALLAEVKKLALAIRRMPDIPAPNVATVRSFIHSDWLLEDLFPPGETDEHGAPAEKLWMDPHVKASPKWAQLQELALTAPETESEVSTQVRMVLQQIARDHPDLYSEVSEQPALTAVSTIKWRGVPVVIDTYGRSQFLHVVGSDARVLRPWKVARILYFLRKGWAVLPIPHSVIEGITPMDRVAFLSKELDRAVGYTSDEAEPSAAASTEESTAPTGGLAGAV